ncbi:MAG: hypothetical protein OEV85_06630 [Candidatus Thorarchaeota archaeon]|nr:hypothetical protein [Candidatus Thorarchaeota archaeon]
MSEGKIIDYSRQDNINKAFAIIALLFAIGGIIIYNFYVSELTFLIVDFGMPIILLIISLGLGYGSKKAIDYIPGEWASRKAWVSFSEYEVMADEYEDAYGDLYAHPSDSIFCCCIFPIAIAIGVMVYVFQIYGSELINPFLDSILLVGILYSVVSVAGFVIGFRIPQIDAKEFFKAPIKGDTYKFASELEGVPGIRAGMSVELGVRSGVQTILGAEVKSYVQGLPETVQVKVQVSHSGFAYPYLVGTVYKGYSVASTTEHHRIRTKYPALLEYSMDDDVAVIVARFDIPERSSSVPNISTNDFRKLAAFLATKLKENYDAANPL